MGIFFSHLNNIGVFIMSRFGNTNDFIPSTGTNTNFGGSTDDKQRYCVYKENYDIYINIDKNNISSRDFFMYRATYSAKINCVKKVDEKDLGDPEVDSEDGVLGPGQEPGEKVWIWWSQVKVCEKCKLDKEDEEDKSKWLTEKNERWFCFKTVNQAYKGGKGAYHNVMKELWKLGGGGQPADPPPQIDMKELKKALKKLATYLGCRPDMKCEVINKKCRKKKAKK